MPTAGYIAEVKYPAANPYRLVPFNYPTGDSRYNTKAFDLDWFANTLPNFQDNPKYKQLLQSNDTITIQYKAANNVAGQSYYSKIDVYKHTPSKTSGEYANLTKMTVSGAIAPTTSFPTSELSPNNQAWVIYHYNINLPYSTDLSSLAAGTYFIVCTTAFSSDGSGTVDIETTHISEPILVADTHAGSQLLEFTSAANDNNLDLNFENVGFPTFSIRVDAAFSLVATGGDFTTYRDASYNEKQLNVWNYRTYEWQVGTGYLGISDYLLDKLMWALSAAIVKIDGYQYILGEESKRFDVQTIPRTPKRTASIKLTDASIDGIGYSPYTTPVFVLTLPTSYPYAISYINLNRYGRGIPAAQIINPTAPFVLNSSADRTTLLTQLNHVAHLTYSLNGSFSYSGNDLLWTNSGTPISVTGGTSKILTKYFRCAWTPYSGSVANAFTYTITGTNFAMEHGDGSVFGELWSTSHSISNTYNFPVLSATSRNATLFYDDAVFNNPTVTQIQAWTITDGTHLASATLSGSLPQWLKVFRYQVKTTTFDFHIFTNYATGLVLQEFHMRSCVTSTFSNLATTPMAFLKTVDVSYNALTESNANQFISDLYNGTYVAIGTIQAHGTMDISGQSGGGSFNTSQAQYVAMTTSPILWTITHD